MAVQFNSISAQAQGTTSLSVAYPVTGLAAGDLFVLAITNKYPANVPTDPASPWILQEQMQGGAGAAGADSGEVTLSVYTRIAVGDETGNLSVTLTSSNSANAWMARYTKQSSYTWDIGSAEGTDNSSGTGYSVVMDSDPGITGNDLVVVCSGLNGNSVNHVYGSQALSASGLTVGAMNERADVGTNQGDDCAGMICDFAITSGTSGGVATFTATLGASAAGPAVLLRLREVAPAGPAIPVIMNQFRQRWN